VSALPVCEPRLLLELVNGDREIFRSLAGILDRETHLRFDDIASAAAAGDVRAMGIAAHALKGTVCNVGASELVSLLKAIEHAGLREARACEPAQLDALRLQLQLIRNEVDDFLRQL
jgi:HPt (histidine-containing phosphotransfer) domain-containing protein